MLKIKKKISVGDYDFVLNSLKRQGVKINFWKVAMRPGKPLSFGTYQDKLVFGLPGNPVSSMISFIQFVQPAILKMQGRKNYFPKQIKAVLGEKINKKAGLRYFLRTYLTYENEEFKACLTGPQGSGILSSMLLAHGIMIIPEEITSLNKRKK
ncbi:MAG: molybdopterin molybdenumtransferase MoeA, partial [Armatimonadetes bacterium]|nr:molybdopterin molybdenumtransferase MoeA [Armatimonadota bacterium]